MKNKEKFHDEIFEIACDGRVLAVTKKGIPSVCDSFNCKNCLFHEDSHCLSRISNRLKNWLESEYEEPSIDWGEVPVDTPILVRNSEDALWSKRYFAKYEDEIVYTWMDGRTSWSAMYPTEFSRWKYAKLAEMEE